MAIVTHQAEPDGDGNRGAGDASDRNEPGSNTLRLRLLALSRNEWGGMWMNRQQLLSRLARRHSVHYCTGATDIWHRDEPTWEQASLMSRTELSDGVLLDVPGKLLCRWQTIDPIDRFALRMTARRWQNAAAAMPGSASVLYSFHPDFFPYLRHLQFDRLVYHAYDRFDGTPGTGKERQAWERQMLERADLVVATSEPIRDHLAGQVERDVFVLPNGVDFDAFSNPSAAVPDDLKDIAAPRAGYVGRINRKVDLVLINELAATHPDISFVFVGPVSNLDDSTKAACARLELRTNVHFLGEKSRQTLPDYVQHMDVGMMCYRTDVGMWVNAGYPLKLHEYLAAALPIVSSDLPSLRPFGHVVEIATTPAQWSACLLAALKDNRPRNAAMRQQVARENSWDRLVERLEARLLGLFPGI